MFCCLCAYPGGFFSEQNMVSRSQFDIFYLAIHRVFPEYIRLFVINIIKINTFLCYFEIVSEKYPAHACLAAEADDIVNQTLILHRMIVLSDGAGAGVEATIRSGLQVQFSFLARNVAGDCIGLQAGWKPGSFLLFCSVCKLWKSLLK